MHVRRLSLICSDRSASVHACQICSSMALGSVQVKPNLYIHIISCAIPQTPADIHTAELNPPVHRHTWIRMQNTRSNQAVCIPPECFTVVSISTLKRCSPNHARVRLPLGSKRTQKKLISLSSDCRRG